MNIFSLFAKKFHAGGVKSTIFTLLTATLGAGVLTMPNAFRSSGIFFSFGQLWGAAIVSYISITCLVTYNDNLKIYAAFETKKFTYSELAQHCYGTIFRIYVDVIFFLNNFGTALSYLILVTTKVTIR